MDTGKTIPEKTQAPVRLLMDMCRRLLWVLETPNDVLRMAEMYANSQKGKANMALGGLIKFQILNLKSESAPQTNGSF